MAIISVLCPECKNFMKVEISAKRCYGQDCIPYPVAQEVENKACICEHCGVLNTLETKQSYRVDAKVVF